MSGQAPRPHDALPTDETDEDAIRALYRRMLDGWNARDADAYATAFGEDGEAVGFDGSEMSGRAEIADTLRRIFADHPTAAYVAKVRGVCFLAPEVAILRAIVGMLPPGSTDLNPQVNALQTVVAAKGDGEWRIVLLQNTPAQFHGQPELVQQMTQELQELL
jgi:uncharacterized protein (TIGR02246 family)